MDIRYYGDKISKRIAKTPEGFLICQDVPISRTGYQKYLASELLGKSVHNDKVIPVYRPAEEVFDIKSLASFEGKPVTNEHPDEDVTPENYQRYSCGHVQNVHIGEGEDSNKVLADLYITDPVLIRLIECGKREISCGYYAVEKKDPQGKICQTRIRGNHVAVVQNGRAGAKVCIRDKNPFLRREKMKKRKNRIGIFDDDYSLDENVELQNLDDDIDVLADDDIDVLDEDFEDDDIEVVDEDFEDDDIDVLDEDFEDDDIEVVDEDFEDDDIDVIDEDFEDDDIDVVNEEFVGDDDIDVLDEDIEDDDIEVVDEDFEEEGTDEDLTSKANSILNDAKRTLRDAKRELLKFKRNSLAKKRRKRRDSEILNIDDDIYEDDEDILTEEEILSDNHSDDDIDIVDDDDIDVLDEDVFADDDIDVLDEDFEDDDIDVLDEDVFADDDIDVLDEDFEDDDIDVVDEDFGNEDVDALSDGCSKDSDEDYQDVEVTETENLLNNDESEQLDTDKTKALREITEASRGISDPNERKHLQDAIYKALCGKSQMADVMRITKKNLKNRMDSVKNDKMKVNLSKQQDIYDSLNPHKKTSF